MLTRYDLEAREVLTLAPYSVLSRDAQRLYPEPESQGRTAFQKDRDRVLHTEAFRRLEYKTQVFMNAQGDHYRTRLTHTLEVQQVARSVALTLGLNETLAETIALTHDLGHPPFGHAGERVLDSLMKNYGGEDNNFDHNTQALRIVTLLENRYPNFPGLNLTTEVLDGLNKHARQGLRMPSLEAQLVDMADALAYLAHDLDDGLRSGLITSEHLSELSLWQELLERTSIKNSQLSERARRTLHRELLGWLIDDLTSASYKAIMASEVKSTDAVHIQPKYLIRYSGKLAQCLNEAKTFLLKYFYNHWRINIQVEQAIHIIKTLFITYLERPNTLPPAVLVSAESDNLPRAICDFIAGMTDRYATQLYNDIVLPPGFAQKL